ncbi:MAG TPA: D-arabinono-1,4-lactone oxidase [Polyangiaceae bacterium]|nr:D-arabinono-1,4-lactone oxidase [Polyangiaceae bacterium]
MTTPAAPWCNWSDTQRVYAKHIERPASLAALQEIVRDVSGRQGRLKPVATGLSFSDILQSDDTLVEMTGLLGEPSAGALLPLESELFRQSSRTPLVRIPCGARIRSLNAALASAGLGFTNLGGYDAQTFVGAVSTSTHGSGANIPPLSDGVRSLDVLLADGSVLRLEPNHGVTDPDKFAHRYGATRRLVQNDEWFWSVVVSLGCMGIILSVVVAVSPAYRLLERRKLSTWVDVQRAIDGGVLDRVRNYEVLVNPYRRRDGHYSCLVTERWVAHPEQPRVPLPPERRSAESLTFLATSQGAVVAAMNSDPRIIPAFLEFGLGVLQTGPEHHLEDSAVIYNIGKINTAHVISGEYFFPVAGYRAAIEALFHAVDRNRKRGVHQPAPFSLRFVSGSRAPLSMARRERHCAIEIAAFKDLHRAAETLLEYERVCIAMKGRPHWAQSHELTGQPQWLAAAYPDVAIWQRARQALDPRGLFSNHFTDRLGLS